MHTDRHPSEYTGWDAVEVRRRIVSVNDLDVFLPEELHQLSDFSPTHSGLVAEHNHLGPGLFGFGNEWSTVFKTDYQPSVRLAGKTIDKIDDDAFQPANLQTSNNVSNGNHFKDQR